ncbi:MAG TPA: chloride channel protein, partial [Galbitalea sp.]|nr:chloride channel protein [Galbitalea sp.]
AFLTGFPSGIALHNPTDYLLVAVLAVVAALIGLLFKTVLYKMEDLWDLIWKKRPEWARPAVGGLVLGLLLLALPQMYGVGYPVMFTAIAGNYALWFLLILMLGKILATSLTLGIGGSGGIFAPSLFIGVTSGMAFGLAADHLFGPAAGNPALYAAVAMGAVFTSAARAPLTSLASVVEMTGDFTLTLPVMLAVGVATAVSRGISYGTIYTTKLLRRGQDIDRAAPWRVFADLTAEQAMKPFVRPLDLNLGRRNTPKEEERPNSLPGPVRLIREPQAVFATESLADVLRQLQVYGRDGLPVLSEDGRHVDGWVTNQSILDTVTQELGRRPPRRADTPAGKDRTAAAQSDTARPATPLTGFQIAEVTIMPNSAAVGRTLGGFPWPHGHVAVSFIRDHVLGEPDPGILLTAGDRINLLVRVAP